MKTINKVFLHTPENRYDIISYIPTLNELRNFYIEMSYNFDFISFTQFFKGGNCQFNSGMEEWIHDKTNFIKFYLSNTDFLHYIEIRYGLQDRTNGNILKPDYYTRLGSYHPYEGYVFLEKYNFQMFQLVSLKTGCEIGPTFQDISSIENLSFYGRGNFDNRPAPTIYYIEEEKGSLLAGEYYDWENEENNKVKISFQNGYKAKSRIRMIYFGELPYFLEPEYIKVLCEVNDVKDFSLDYFTNIDEIGSFKVEFEKKLQKNK